MEGTRHDDRQDTSVELPSLPYYFSNLRSITEVVTFLRPHIDHDGCFILRDSVRRQGSVTISVVQGGGVKHINIGTHRGKYFLTNKKFGTVAELIEYYRTNEVPNAENISKVCLTTPLYFKDFDSSTTQESKTRVTGTRLLKTTLSETGPEITRESPSLVRAQSDSPAFRTSPHTLATAPEMFKKASPRQRRTNVSQGPNPVINTAQSAGEGETTDNQLTSASSSTNTKQNHIQSVSSAAELQEKMNVNNNTKCDVTDQSQGSRSVSVTGSPPKEELLQQMMRPPPPLPHFKSHGYGYSRGGLSLQYAEVRDTEVDHSADLIAQLAMSDAAMYSDKCECGLLIEDAELPMGWTVHLTKPEEHTRKAFFVTPTMESCWHLPKNIENMISSRQKLMLKDLGVI